MTETTSTENVPVLEPALEAPRPAKRKKTCTEGEASCVLVKKAVVDAIRAQNPAMRCGGGYLESLNASVLELVDASISRATANQRQTVRPCDL